MPYKLSLVDPTFCISVCVCVCECVVGDEVEGWEGLWFKPVWKLSVIIHELSMKALMLNLSLSTWGLSVRGDRQTVVKPLISLSGILRAYATKGALKPRHKFFYHSCCHWKIVHGAISHMYGSSLVIVGFVSCGPQFHRPMEQST